MFFIYEVLGLIFIIFSPIIFLIRIILGKEDPKRFLEKFCIYSKRFKIRKTIWLHGSSIGEILSIIPIINVLEKNNKIIFPNNGIMFISHAMEKKHLKFIIQKGNNTLQLIKNYYLATKKPLMDRF